MKLKLILLNLILIAALIFAVTPTNLDIKINSDAVYATSASVNFALTFFDPLPFPWLSLMLQLRHQVCPLGSLVVLH